MAPQSTFLQSETKQPVLPWERDSGDAAKVGICLSGGGIRAAMFSLGVLQVLQEERKLVFGEKSADYLSVVSGGSYMAGAHALGALARSENLAHYGGMDPLAQGSPEEAHILSHGEYLWKNPLRYAGWVFLNLVSVFTLFALLAFILACLAAVLHGIAARFDWVDTNPLAVTPPGWLAFVGGVGFGGFYWVMMWAYSRADWWRLRVVLLCLVLATICIYPALQYTADRVDWLPTPYFWAIIAALGGVIVVVTLLGRSGRLDLTRAVVVNAIALWTPRILAFVFIVWIAVWLYPNVPVAIGTLDRDRLDWIETTLLIVVLFPLLGSGLPSGLHREYRRRLMSCYGVTRAVREARVARDSAISILAPLDGHGDASFPRLLISATANVRHQPPGKPVTTFVPYIVSHDHCGAPSIEDSTFPTPVLEGARVRTNPFTRSSEPLLSLFTAIACTGAAIAPNMGYKTIPSVRPFIAALNFRLGRWFPNPFNERAQRAVEQMPATGELDFKSAFGDEHDELMTEVMGLYGPRMYISDGGHYDNLGLLALLRARCATIYCVDAGSDPGGKVDELERLIEIARVEKIVDDIEIDLSPFRTGAEIGFDETHRHGPISYRGGASGELIVLKLGLTSASAGDLKKLAARNRAAPLQSRPTFLTLVVLAVLGLITLVSPLIPIVSSWSNLSWTAAIGLGLALILVACQGLWSFQLHPTNSALNGYFPHHSTFGKLGFTREEATAYRDTGREVAARALADWIPQPAGG